MDTLLQNGPNIGGVEGTEESLVASFGALLIRGQDIMLWRLQRLTSTVYDIKTQAGCKSDEQSCLAQVPSNRLSWERDNFCH